MTPRPTWLLIPGHLCDARLWDDLRAALQAAGAATADADVSRDASIDAMARRALKVVEGPLVPVGFSMGGMVALRMQLLAPDRIAGMVLVDTNADADLPERSAARRVQQRCVAAGGLDEVLAEMARDYLAPGNAGRDDLLDPIGAMARAAGADVFARQSEAIRLRPDARPSLPGIASPVLVIAGQDDALCPPAWQRALVAPITDGALVLVNGAGHFLPLEAPQALREAVLHWGAKHDLL